MNKIPTTIPLTVGGEHRVTHRTTRSLATGKLVSYILASRPTVARYDVGDRVDLAGTYWWDRRLSGSRIAKSRHAGRRGRTFRGHWADDAA